MTDGQDQRVFSKRFEVFGEKGRRFGDMRRDVSRLVNVQAFQRYRRGERVAVVGAAMHQEAAGVGSLGDLFIKTLREGEHAERAIARIDPFSQGHSVGANAEPFGAELRAELPEAGYDFVVDKRNVAGAQNLADLRK